MDTYQHKQTVINLANSHTSSTLYKIRHLVRCHRVNQPSLMYSQKQCLYCSTLLRFRLAF